ncbi:hypothetical protein PG997_000110 [Apiospora hydei]|uniref:HTH psq-type domain-containing protein n=1 Tax=Apiospora hydei TaxID=1337664 RepID=A0ABR1X9P6_9PEZI
MNQYSEGELQEALDCVANGTPIKQAAREYGQRSKTGSKVNTLDQKVQQIYKGSVLTRRSTYRYGLSLSRL